MDDGQRGKILGGLAGLVAGISPLKSLTFLLALGVAAVAAWVWFKQSGDPQPPFPIYGAIAASFAGGFLIGRVFRKVVKTAALLAAIALGGLALLGYARVDTSKAREAVAAGTTWVQDQAGRAREYLLRFLPSGSAAGTGVFAGAGRRRRGGVGKPG
jgi:uncharacterized membrane protein (Fun14 family)